jgi:hypothetical protein
MLYNEFIPEEEGSRPTPGRHLKLQECKKITTLEERFPVLSSREEIHTTWNSSIWGQNTNDLFFS